MAKTYRSYLPEQNLLLPPSLREWLPDDHLAFFVSDVVDQLNLSAIESVYEEDDARTDDGKNAPAFAQERGHNEVAKYLLELGLTRSGSQVTLARGHFSRP